MTEQTSPPNAQERQALADEAERNYAERKAASSDVERFERACEAALIDMKSAPVLRLRAFILDVSDPSNPDADMAKWADIWLKSTAGLVQGAQARMAAKFAREVDEAANASET